MTLLTIVKNEDFIFFGADTRRTRLDNGAYEDGLQKVLKTKIGYIAGTGLEELIFSVNHEVINNSMDNIKEILELIIKTKTDFLNKYKNNNTNVIEAILSTSWILTYKDENNKLKAIYFNSFKNSFEDIVEETFIMGYPEGIKEELILKLSDKTYETIKNKANIKNKDEEKRIKALTWITEKIYEYSETRKGISKCFFLAKHNKNKNIEDEKIEHFYKHLNR